MSGMIEEALRYFERGWHPIPLERAILGREGSGKRPLGKWREIEWTREEIKRVFAGDVNIGLDCGKSNLVVIDCDSQEGLEYALSVCEPTGTIVETGSGNKHLYFKAAEGMIIGNRQRIMGLGLDRRSYGGVVAAPRSKHYSGVVYRFVQDDGMPEYNPNWFREPEIYPMPRLVDETEDSEWIKYRARRYCSRIVSEAGKGGDVAAFKVACALVQKFGLAPDEALEEMRIWNHYMAKPPWPDSRLRYKISEAVKLSHRQ